MCSLKLDVFKSGRSYVNSTRVRMREGYGEDVVPAGDEYGEGNICNSKNETLDVGRGSGMRICLGS